VSCHEAYSASRVTHSLVPDSILPYRSCSFSLVNMSTSAAAAVSSSAETAAAKVSQVWLERLTLTPASKIQFVVGSSFTRALNY
jgi:hypothetical protein